MRHFSRMNAMWLFVVLRLLLFGVLTKGLSANVSARPKVVTVGAIFAYNSTIGRVARIAIEEAVKDVNLNSSVLQGTELLVNMHSSNCSGFVGMVGALQFMESETIAIIGPQSSVVAHTISHVANELQVPLVSFAATDPTLTSLQFPYFVRATTSDLHQMTAISEIIEFYAWRDVIVIFLDDDYGRNGVAALTDALSAKRCKISYKAGIPPAPGVNRTDIMDILIKVALLEPRVIVLHAYPRIGFMVFDVARYLGMVGDGYAWIATDWLSSVLDSSFPLPSETMNSLQGILTLLQHTPDSERKGAFSSRWNKITGGSPGLNSYAFYAYDTVWLLAHAIDSFLNQGGNISFSNDSRLQSVAGSHMHFEAMSIFDGGPHLLKNILETDFVGLTGQVKFDPDRSLVFPAYDIINVVGTGVRRIGYWSNYSGLSTLTPESLRSKPPNRSSVNQRLYSVVWPGETVTKPRGWVFPSSGRLLKIAVPKRVSYTEFLSQVPGTNVFKGYCVDVFTAAVNLLPYAVPYQFIPFGNGHENPSYSELVRLITTGDFDGAVGDIAIVTNRTRIVDFSQPYVSSGLVVVAPFIKHHTGAWAFLRPFSRSLWGVTAAFFLFVGFVVWTLEHRNNDEFRGPPKKQLITMIWFSLSTMFFSHRENTVSTLGRMVLLIWLFVVLIITSSYTASLTSILTVQQLYSPIKGIDSLKETKDPIGFQVGSFAENYLVEEIGIDRSRLVPLGSPEAYARALERGPKNGGVAAVVDELPYVELFLSRECRFRIIGQEFTRSGWGFAFPRDSPLAVDLSTAILALSENGDLQRIHDKWLTRSACSSDNTEIDSERLHLTSFFGLYLLCGIACFIALLIYFFQIMPECKHAAREDSESSQRGGSSRSKRLKTLLSVMDEKVDRSSSGGSSRKKRKTERAHSTGDIHIKFSNS